MSQTVEDAKNGIPIGIRTRVAGMKTRCPRPLDDRDAFCCDMLPNIPHFLRNANQKKQKNEIFAKKIKENPFFIEKMRKQGIFITPTKEMSKYESRYRKWSLYPGVRF